MITSQRKIISDYLKNTATHPSAEEIYRRVRRILPRISKGTVYRNLNTLKEEGEIQEISASESRYDGDISSHAHYICQKCGKIFDIFEDCRNCEILKHRKTKVGKISQYQINFYGHCKHCQ